MIACLDTLKLLLFYRLPNNVSFEEAALLEPLAMAHHACHRGGVTGGSSVLICGAGSRGIMAMQCAKNFGATNVTITGK